MAEITKNQLAMLNHVAASQGDDAALLLLRHMIGENVVPIKPQTIANYGAHSQMEAAKTALGVAGKYPTEIGATVGGMVGGVPGAIIGGAIGETVRQGIRAYEGGPVTPTSVFANVEGQAALSGVAQYGSEKLAQGIIAVKRASAPTVANIIQSFSGPPSKYGKPAVENLEFLSNTPTKQEAQGIYKNIVSNKGYLGLEKYVEKTTSNFTPNQGDWNRLYQEARILMKQGPRLVEEGRMSTEELLQRVLVGRQAANKLTTSGKLAERAGLPGAEEYRALRASYTQGKMEMDFFLAEMIPGYKKATTAVFESNAREAFKPVIPYAGGGTSNAFRMLVAGSLASKAYTRQEPAYLAPVALMSPFGTALALKGLGVAGRGAMRASPGLFQALKSNLSLFPENYLNP